MTNDLPRTQSLDIEAITLQYLSYPGAQPTIVLLHATGFLPGLWHPIARKIAPAHRVIAPYFCDHREADLGKGGLNWMVLAQDLAKLCKILEIEKPLLVGHSMGATVVTYAQAACGIDASGMILIEPIFFPEDYYRMNLQPADHSLAIKSLKRRNQWNDADDVKAYLKTRTLFANWEEEFLDLYVAHGTVKNKNFGLELACPPPNEAAMFMGSVSSDPWPMLPRIQCPVLVLEGAESSNRDVIDLPVAASQFPKGRYRCIADAGHLIPMEKSAEILQIILEFARSI